MQTNNRHKYLISSLIIICLFFILSFLVNKDIFRKLDYDTTFVLQNIINRNFDIPMSIFTPLGSTEITFLILVFIFFYVVWSQKHLFFGLLMYFLIFVFEIAGKLFIFHPDPPPFFYRYALGVKMPSSFVIDTDFSYPSGHMARTFFLGFIIASLIWSRNIIWYKKVALFIPLAVYLIMTFLSRIYLGEHWVSDVVGGVLLGAFTANLTFVFW